jgi:quercetin dioxygenase-like cupin family protein
VRIVVAGVDEEGRSCALRDEEVEFTEVAPGLAWCGVFATSQVPPPTRPPGRGDLVDLGVPPGICNWSLWQFEPSGTYSMHHTDTVDFDVIVAGAVELVLDDGVHQLGQGDCVVMQGVDHAWQAGPQGCTISATAIGTPPAD